MITVYTPGEKTKTLVSEYRNPKRASEDFSASWFINRNEEMDWVCHSGDFKDKADIRVCIMTGLGEPITQDAIDCLCALLSRLIGNTDPQAILRFGISKPSRELKSVQGRIVQQLKIERKSLVNI